MDVDPSDSLLKDKADALDALVSGPLAAAAAKASNRSRGIPAGKDFHFFFNFDEFKVPVKRIKEKAESSLRSIAALDGLWGNKKQPEWPEDLDDAYDWLVNLNDELLDRLAVSMDEFKGLRGKEEEGAGGKTAAMEEDGFQLVYGKKKKKWGDSDRDEGFSGLAPSTAVNVAMNSKRTAARPKVPFHIPSIPRPQEVYNILVNNQNQPFDHVWLEMSADGTRYIHPLEKLHVQNFVDRKCDKDEPVQPLSLEATPFKLVNNVNDLKMVASKLHSADEFAVDLEHNQYRSFQGLTCLMQISTRTEDFVIDTLKLRVHVGPYLREVFKDPSKRKIMHGADHDIIWLQRDFGIYVCHLFDTGQASRVLQLERNSLEYLLSHFCGVNANKEYQNADWRLRPLPEEMLKYAREDTHYLFYIFDQMKKMLITASSSENDFLLEVYKRSSEICMQLYEKELYTEISFLNIYGLSGADLNSKQLAVVAGLYQWRDNTARAEDESTGYILPNKTLIEIARQMPFTSGKLRQLVKSKHPFVAHQLHAVMSIIKNSINNSSAFEVLAQKLKEGRVEVGTEENDCDSPATDDLVESASAKNVDNAGSLATITSVETVNAVGHVPAATDYCVKKPHTESSSCKSSATRVGENKLMTPGIGCSFKQAGITERIEETLDIKNTEYLQPKKDGIASVQLVKKHTSAFGALFGNAPPRRVISDKEDINVKKVEQIKSTVSLPFHQFSGVKPSEPHAKETHSPAAETVRQHPADLPYLDVIPLDTESDTERSPTDSPMADEETNIKGSSSHPEGSIGGDVPPSSSTVDEPMSPSDLTSSFENCFKSVNERKNSQQKPKLSQDPETNFSLRPFDYSAARQNIKFDEVKEADEAETEGDIKTSSDSKQMHRDSAYGKALGEEGSRGALQPRRRQAFPPSGNRSTTYH